MATWSTERKYAYFFAFIVVLVILVGIPVFLLFYKAPTCFDNVQNGNERGIDCGGSCSRLCPADFSAPRILWSYSTRVLPGVYNSLAYIQNPNNSVQAASLSYEFKIYDDQGILIARRNGTTFVPAGQKFAVFEPSIETGNRIPARTTFEFTGTPNWVPGTILSKIHVLDTTLNQGDKPSAEVKVENASVDESFSNISAFIILYDKDDNRVSFSKTVIDSLAPTEKTSIYYTWPESFAANIVRTEVIFMKSSVR